jgi:hypothetical protein
MSLFDVNNFDQYKFVIPETTIEIIASDDRDACEKAKNKDNPLTDFTGATLFRYPKEWLSGKSVGLIEVPFFQIKGTV